MLSSSDFPTGISKASTETQCIVIHDVNLFNIELAMHYRAIFKYGCFGGGRNRIGRREKWPKKSWKEGEIGRKSREEGEKET